MKLLLALFFLSISAQATPLPSSLQGASISSQKVVKLNWSELDKTQKAWVVVFLSAKCPCSDSHIQELKKAAKDFPEFRFIAIHSNSDESADLTKKYFADKSLPFEVLQDQETQIADTFKALKTPHAYVVSKEGEILYQGGVTNSANAPAADKHFLLDALSDIKSGSEVRLKNGRTLGCIIQRESEKNSW